LFLNLNFLFFRDTVSRKFTPFVVTKGNSYKYFRVYQYLSQTIKPSSSGGIVILLDRRTWEAYHWPELSACLPPD
jgi:hypothetical protein